MRKLFFPIRWAINLFANPQTVTVTNMSQANVLASRMQQAKITHGQTVRADIENVRIRTVGPEREPVLYFCDTKRVKIKSEINTGDGGELPTQSVKLDGLETKGTGYFDLKNVLITSNGSLEVTADKETKLALA